MFKENKSVNLIVYISVGCIQIYTPSARDSFVWGLVFFRLKINDSYVWGLVILTFGG